MSRDCCSINPDVSFRFEVGNGGGDDGGWIGSLRRIFFTAPQRTGSLTAVNMKNNADHAHNQVSTSLSVYLYGAQSDASRKNGELFRGI